MINRHTYETALKDRQYVYQPGKSKELALDDLNRLISRTIMDKEIVKATFLHIEDHLNNAATHSLVKPLARRQIDATLCQWVKVGLSNKLIISTIDDIREDAISAQTSEEVTRIFWTCRGMCEKNYGPLVWWHRSRLAYATGALSKILKIACFAMTRIL